MNRNAIASVLVAALVLLAGCSGGISGSPSTAMDGSTTDGQSTASAAAGSTGTVNLYISDEQNAISDFEHLNVTISKVGLKPAGDVDDESADEDADDSDDQADEGADSTDVDDANQTVDDNETAAATETATTEEPDDDVDDEEAEADDENETDDDWVEYEVDNRTVDLTRLQGANATQLSTLDVPNGTYEKVFVYVSDVNGTLNDGSDQRVKLPSGKLQLNSEFTVGNGESVDFVFDITVVESGNSGKYILKPVISESGTDVEIERVDDDDAVASDDDDDPSEARESALDAGFVGNVTRGEDATLSVTWNGSALENATVSVGDERIGTTDANGRLSVPIPADADDIDVTVRYGGTESELEVDFETEEAESDSGPENRGSSQSAADG